jgi:cyanophycinase
MLIWMRRIAMAGSIESRYSLDAKGDPMRFVPLALCAALLLPQAATAKLSRYLTGSATNVTPTLHGPALNLGGGGLDVDSALQAMIDLARGCTGSACGTKVDVVILRATGSNGYNDYIYAMNGVDSVETLVMTRRTDTAAADINTTIRNAEVVFFAGGDQCDYVTLFKGTPVETAVEYVLEQKRGAVGGTSAGMAIQSPTAYDACVASVTSADILANPYHRGATFTRGFFNWPFMADTITDQHFVTRDRMGRLMGFLARQIKDGYGTSVMGVAADEQTSIVVDANGLATVHGNPGAPSTAYFVLADHAIESSDKVAAKQPLSYANFKIWKVPAGSTFDLARRPSLGFYTVSVSNGVLSAPPY